MLGALNGRIDHVFQNFNALMNATITNQRRVYLVDHESLAFLLVPVLSPHSLKMRQFFLVTNFFGIQDIRHEIHLTSCLDGPDIGLLPLGAPCEAVTTTGLQWNLGLHDVLHFFLRATQLLPFLAIDHEQLAFGGLVSSSNRIAETAQPGTHSPTGLSFRTATISTDTPLFWTNSLCHESINILLKDLSEPK